MPLLPDLPDMPDLPDDVRDLILERAHDGLGIDTRRALAMRPRRLRPEVLASAAATLMPVLCERGQLFRRVACRGEDAAVLTLLFRTPARYLPDGGGIVVEFMRYRNGAEDDRVTCHFNVFDRPSADGDMNLPVRWRMTDAHTGLTDPGHHYGYA